MNAPTVRLEGGRLCPAGDLVFDDALAVVAEGERLIAAGEGPLVVDLSGVGRCNSVAASVLLAWQRRALACGRDLRVAAVPPALAGILRLCGVDELLPTA